MTTEHARHTSASADGLKGEIPGYEGIDDHNNPGAISHASLICTSHALLVAPSLSGLWVCWLSIGLAMHAHSRLCRRHLKWCLRCRRWARADCCAGHIQPPRHPGAQPYCLFRRLSVRCRMHGEIKAQQAQQLFALVVSSVAAIAGARTRS